MTAIKIVEKATKVAIAVAAVKAPGSKVIVLATQFGVSESTVRRSIKEFTAEAQEIVAAEAKKAEAATKPVKAKRVKVESAVEAGPRGYKGRNGRWSILNKLFDEKGLANVAELYVEANKRSVEAGLTPLNKNSFYAMVGIARKLRKQAAETTVETVSE